MSQVAEIHVMQKLHKEKVKKIKMESTNEKGVVNEDNKTCGCGKKVVCAIRQLLSCAGSKPTIWDYKDA